MVRGERRDLSFLPLSAGEDHVSLSNRSGHTTSARQYSKDPEFDADNSVIKEDERVGYRTALRTGLAGVITFCL